MLGKLIRLLFAITAMAPITISLAYVYGKEKNWQMAFIAACVCVLLGALSLWIVRQAGERLERMPITVKKTKSADKEVIGFFIAYALPLLFRGQVPLDIGSWVVAAAMLFFVLWSTHTLQVNPVLGVFGFHFYEVETDGGVTYLLIARRKISNVKSISHIVQLTEYGILEATKK